VERSNERSAEIGADTKNKKKLKKGLTNPQKYGIIKTQKKERGKQK
jgi:hypothetical protein